MQTIPYEKYTLPNGLRLILVPMSGVSSVATAVMVGVGSRYETPAINGVSHFLEHMVFKGTKKYPTTEDVNIIERVGGLQNAYTDIDITNYHNKVLSTDWSLALEINKELATKPLLEQKHIDKERDVILEEMKRYEDEPAAKVGEAFHSMMYPGTSLGMRIIGERESLLASKGETLRGYHDKWYTPERMVVILAGRIRNQESGIREKTEKWFGTLHDSRFMIHDSKVTDTQLAPRLSVVTKPDASQAHLNLGLRTFARASEDRFAWSILNMIMGVGFTSRLFKEIREKRGLCYSIRSSSDSWADVGYWSIYAGVATEKVEEATKAILGELGKAAEKGVLEEEVAVSKKRIKTVLAFKSEDPEFFTEFYGRQELYGMPILTIEDYIKRLERVTKEDIDKLLKRYVVTNTLNMALVWNKSKDETLEKLLHL
ncbi:MAG: pitrilysin family protein [Patescibacteria group bacterium]